LLKNLISIFAVSSINIENSAQGSDVNQEESTAGESTVEKVGDALQEHEEEVEQQSEPAAATALPDNTVSEVTFTDKNPSSNEEDNLKDNGVHDDNENFDENADLVVKDEVSEDDEHVDNVTSQEQDNIPGEREHFDFSEPAAVDTPEGEVAASENPPSTNEDDEPQEQQKDKTDEMHDLESKDDEGSVGDSDEVAKGDDGNDLSMEDDVLDMLDYDIEMPDQSQAEQADNDDAKQSDAKGSEDMGKKDSAVASERLVCCIVQYLRFVFILFIAFWNFNYM